MDRESTKEWTGRERIDPEDPQGRYARLTQSARIQGQIAWLELLRDREEWNTTPDWAQDEAIRAVAAQLGGGFSFLRTEIYECGGQSHRIAQFEHRSTGARLNLLPGGRFDMGGRQSDTQPIHPVSLRPFLMGATALTQSQWDSVGGTSERRWLGPERPIENVSWEDAQDWLTKAGGGLGLPSEAQWEYACRAGTQSEYCFGDEESELRGYSWYSVNSGEETHEVAALKPNAFGLYDVHGNVWEWCQDRWHDNYNDAPGDGLAWTARGDPSKRVNRGGAWKVGAGHLHSACRIWFPSSSRFSFLGFRLCLSLERIDGAR